jgi:CRISPR-associated protein Cas1
MIKRTLFLGSDAYLHTKDKQMIISFTEKDRSPASVPIEDIGVVVLEAYQMTISLNLITSLLENNVALITCNKKKMPKGLLLNLEGNILQQERFHDQISVSLPLKKQLWKQTIQAKIHNQAALLAKLGIASNLYRGLPRNMRQWKESVQSGDPDNFEARAAVYYWRHIFNEYIPNFIRGRDEAAPNNFLNYGYAVLRAVTARALVASGLLPTFGIHHHNRYNAYALADDIMEPYRPYVDEIVYRLVVMKSITNDYELTREMKAELLQIPAIDVHIDGEKSPLMIAMQRTTASLYQCMSGNSRKIIYPELQ